VDVFNDVQSARQAELLARALYLRCKGWKVRCPTKDGQNPSLQISYGLNAMPAVHCHAGCDQKSVIRYPSPHEYWPRRGEIKPAHAILGLAAGIYKHHKTTPAPYKAFTKRYTLLMGTPDEPGINPDIPDRARNW
jgi:hypothetical protein